VRPTDAGWWEIPLLPEEGWRGAPGWWEHLVCVIWEFTPTRHLSARVTDDSLPVKFAAKRNAQLDEHFREKIYPGIARAAGESAGK
jgi:hypothetical protein